MITDELIDAIILDSALPYSVRGFARSIESEVRTEQAARIADLEETVSQMTTALAAAIAYLYSQDPEDVESVFSDEDLLEVLKVCKKILPKSEKVEDIYQKAWRTLLDIKAKEKP